MAESQPPFVHSPPGPLTRKDGLVLLKDIVLFATASVAITTVLRFFLSLYFFRRKLPEIIDITNGHEVHVNWVSFFTTTSEDAFNRVAEKAIWHLLWAPIYETFIFVLLWKMMRRIRIGKGLYVLVAAVIFGFLHIIVGSGGDIRVLFTGVGGAFFAGIYVAEWYRHGPNVAYVACAGTHFVDNLLIGCLAFVGMKLSS